MSNSGAKGLKEVLEENPRHSTNVTIQVTTSSSALRNYRMCDSKSSELPSVSTNGTKGR